MKTNQLRAMMLTVMLVITTLGGTVCARKGNLTNVALASDWASV